MKTTSSLAVACVAIFACTIASAEAKDAKDFVSDAIQGDNAEIKMGQLAEMKGATPGVREFGKTLIDDHSKAKAEAEMVAQKIGVKASAEEKPEAKQEYDRLAAMTGASFDKEFVNHMVSDHQKDIKEFEEEAKAKHNETSNMAEKQLPTLRKHLQMAEALEKNVNSGTATR